MVVALGVLNALGACSGPQDGVLAQTDLVRLSLVTEANQRVLRLDAEPGVQINAQFPPVFVLRDGRRVPMRNDSLNSDSTYFAGSPRALLVDVNAPRALLRASACPANQRLCRPVDLEVVLGR